MLRVVLVAAILACAAPAAAQEDGDDQFVGPAVAEPVPIYEKSLLRLSEILGALFFLRDLCGADDATYWRETMLGVMDAEQPTPNRRALIVARFNRGVESYRSVYRSCTPSALRAIELYLAEGARLTSDMTTRYAR